MNDGISTLSEPKRLTVNLDSSSVKILEKTSDELGISVSATVRLILHALFSVKVQGSDTLPDIREKIEEYMLLHKGG